MMDADTPRFTLREVALAAGWHLGTMRDYFVRGVFPWAGEEGKAQVAGATSRLSLRASVRLAIAHALWTQGVSPREAFKGATSFTDFGSAPSRNAYGVKRLAGNIFPQGYETLLLWRAGEGARIVPFKQGAALPLDAMIADPFAGQVGPVILVRVDDIVERVMAKLAV
jgi:hypothetical protein